LFQFCFVKISVVRTVLQVVMDGSAGETGGT